jgi:hypothetical protein
MKHGIVMTLNIKGILGKGNKNFQTNFRGFIIMGIVVMDDCIRKFISCQRNTLQWLAQLNSGAFGFRFALLRVAFRR